ncbi:hypothetical protein [Spirosoma validum]|uniref:Lipoprotein n=1 Tax=Spirosoma validum TaxID=2771355 RepID=A0A927GFB5_9BACT|nr:hypothetical protein [Spirosoma validum]MBD2755440.1 hypothetical protein [Spirosoma validum]
MVKKLFTILAWPLLNACSPPVSIAPALSIAGTYKFTQYSTISKSDRAPLGLVTITMVDDQHVDLIAKGTSYKSKIAYSYRNVAVVKTDRNYLGEDTFSLRYKKNQIGIINSDEQGHYVSLTPKPYVTLVAEIPPAEDY